MDLQQQRMECLKMAFELRGNTDPIVSAAQQLLEFVTGTQASTSSEALTEQVTSPEAPAEEPVAANPPEAATEAPTADAIAACGTALVLPESGELADAAPAAQPEQQATQTQLDGAEASQAAAPTEVVSEPSAEVTEPQTATEAPVEAAASQPEPAQESPTISSSHQNQAAEATPEATIEADPPLSSETDGNAADVATLASAPTSE